MFPSELILDKIKNFKSKVHTPVSTDLDDIEKIYSLSYTITHFNGSNIYSFMKIPLIDFSQGFTEIPIPIFSDLALEELESFRTSMHRSLDLFLCSKHDKTIKIMSKSDLFSCKMTASRSLVICHGRHLWQKLNDFSEPCKKIQNNTVIEMDFNRILVKSSEKDIKINCGLLDKTIFLNSTYSIINLDPSCKLIGKDFILDKSDANNFNESFIGEPLEVIHYNVNSLTFAKKPSKLDKVQSKIQSKQINSSEIHESMKHLKLQDKVNKDMISDLNSSVSTHKIINWTAIGVIALLMLTIIGCCFYVMRLIK